MTPFREIADMEQGSTEWFAIRCGKATASRICDAIARTKTGWGASRANYMAELIIERLTGQPAERFTNAAMQWGTDKEPEARAAYEYQHECAVEQIGFVHHPSIAMSGASPDGLVGADGMVEIKCPNTATHLDTLLGQKVPEKYVTQMQWQMACTGRKWCDFVSYDPRLPSHMQLFIKRIERDDKAIADMEQMVRDFLDEVAAKIAMLDKIYAEAA
jgi:putative phage-type endonuclease